MSRPAAAEADGLAATAAAALVTDSAGAPEPTDSAASSERSPKASSAKKRAKLERSGAKQKQRGAPTPGRCAFFLEKKRRYCSMRPGPGKRYCGVHECEAAAADGGAAPLRPRVPCPIDPSHTVFADQLTHHLKVCTLAKQQRAERQQPYFRAALNAGPALAAPAGAVCPVARTPLRPREDAPGFARRIEALYAAHVGSVRAVHLKAEECDGLLQRASTAGAEHATLRHLTQQASILGNMERVGILRPGGVGGGSGDGAAFVEFGAGRGMLSLAVREALPTAPLLLVERGVVRNKADRDLRKSAATAEFERVKIDIRDLDLRHAPLTERCGRCVAVSKHLCGVATDLTLRCLHNASGAGGAGGGGGAAPPDAAAPQAEPPRPVQVGGIAIALCCHHCMNWTDFVGRDFFAQAGLDAQAFEAIRTATSWCTESAGAKAGLSAEERALCGRRCKRLLDAGRLWWLREVAGMAAELVEYCEPQTSLENALLLAWPRAEPPEPATAVQ